MTTVGAVDLPGEVAGVGNYQEVLNNSEYKESFEMQMRALNLDGLIKAKRAAGRVKDLLVLPEPEALREILTEEG